MRTILIATDLSPRSDRALFRAAHLAARFGSTLHVVHVLDDETPKDVLEVAEKRIGSLLDSLCVDIVRDHDVEVKPTLVRGSTAEGIIKACSMMRADLAVIGPPRAGEPRDVFVGTTAERVMRKAPSPVLMVNAAPAAIYGRVLLAMDMSSHAVRAAREADALGILEGAKVSIVHAFGSEVRGLLGFVGADTESLRKRFAQEALRVGSELRSFLRRHGLEGVDRELILEKGDAGDGILRVAERVSADLLVMGTRGEGAVRRPVLGSLAAEVLRRTASDVLVVPADAAELAKARGVELASDISAVATG